MSDSVRRLLPLWMVCALAWTFPAASPAQLLINENFDNVPALFATGWVQVNRSSPLGPGMWQQGSVGTGIPAHIGVPSAYIMNDFNAGSGVATISAWLITPVITLQNGQTLQFYTRTHTVVSAPDRLQVRMSLAGNSTDVGATATSVGVFTTLLRDINPTYSFAPYPVGYPTSWTAITITLSGIAAPTQGRLALRYFVENGGPAGINSDIVAIDTLTLNATTQNPCLNPLPTCRADVAPVGGNGVVNVDDLLAVILTWGQTGPPRPQGDTAPPPNGNCTVNVDDLLTVITSWGACPPRLGACCFPDGHCSDSQSVAACQGANGVYQGDNSTCGQVICPQPNNDSCAQATAVAIGGSANGNLETANLDFSPTCNNVVAGQGRWHTVVGNGTTLTASICASTGGFNGRLTVYCGPNCDRLLCVVAADNNTCGVNGTKETVSWCSTNGQTYWILVHAQVVNPGQGLYTLGITGGTTCTGAAPCAPVNNNCANALPISNGTTSYSTVGATTDGSPIGSGACFDSGATCAADIWYRYTATCTGTLRITNCAQLGGSVDYDSVIVIYTNGPCPPPDSTRIACNDDDPNNPCGIDLPHASTVTAAVVAGQVYLIRVGGFSDKQIDFGTGVLNVTCGP